MDFTFVTSLPVENDPATFYKAKIERSGNSISLIIFDNSTAYKGEATSEYISKQSKTFNLSEDQYLEECLKAFQNSQSYDFTCSIVGDYFNLKKTIQTNNSNSMKVKFISIKLEKVDFQTSIFIVLDASLQENKQNVKIIEELRSANETLEKGNKLLLEELKEFQNTKSEMESVLYFRFLNLLNSKKKKLRELRKKLGEEIDEDTASEIEEEMELGSGALSNVYDIDTDVDEDVGMAKDESKPMEISAATQPSCIESTETKKELEVRDTVISSQKSSNENSRTLDIYERMTILDPTIPFVS